MASPKHCQGPPSKEVSCSAIQTSADKKNPKHQQQNTRQANSSIKNPFYQVLSDNNELSLCSWKHRDRFWDVNNKTDNPAEVSRCGESRGAGEAKDWSGPLQTKIMVPHSASQSLASEHRIKTWHFHVCGINSQSACDSLALKKQTKHIKHLCKVLWLTHNLPRPTQITLLLVLLNEEHETNWAFRHFQQIRVVNLHLLSRVHIFCEQNKIPGTHLGARVSKESHFLSPICWTSS